MKKGQFAILLAVIVLCAGGIFGYLYFSNNNDNNSLEKTINVVDAFDGNLIYDAEFTNWSARAPKILGNTDTINSLNKKILNQYIYDITSLSVCHAKQNECFPNGLNIKYKYKTYKDIIVIKPYSEGTNDWGGASISYIDYFYDIKNDKELSIIEAAKVLNTDIISDITNKKIDFNNITNDDNVYLDYDSMKFYVSK